MGKRRKLIYGSLSFAVIALAGFLVMNNSWFRRALEKRVIATLEDLTGGRVEVGEFRFAPLSLKITFQEIVVHGSEPPTRPALFSARGVVIRLDPASLLRRRIALRGLEWDSSKINLLTEPDGSSNIPGPRSPMEARRGLDNLLDLSVGRLRLSHTELTWQNQQLPFDLNSQDLTFQMRASGLRSYRGNFSLSDARVAAPGWGSPSINLSSGFEMSRSAIAFPSLQWRAKGLEGKGSLTFKPLPPAQAYVSFQMSGQVAPVAAMLGLAKLDSGDFVLEGQAAYRNGEWASTGKIRCRDVRLPSRGFNVDRMSGSFDYAFDRHHIEATDVFLAVLGGTVRGKAEISIGAVSPVLSANAQVRGVDLDSALRSFSAREISVRLHPSATAEGEVRATWKRGSKDVRCEFDLQLRPRVRRAPGSRPISGTVRGSVTLGKDLLLELNQAEFRAPRSSLAASGTWGQSRSELSLRLHTADFDAWQDFAEYFMEADEPIPIALESSATFLGEVTGASGHAEIRGQLQVGPFKYREWKCDGLTAAIFAAPDRLEIRSGKARLGTSGIALEASLGLHHWQLDHQAPARISVSAQKTGVESLADALGFPIALRGLASGRIELQGTPSSLTGGGSVQLEQAALGEVLVDSLRADLGVEKSGWSLDKIELMKGQGMLTGNARLEPTGRAFSLDLHGTNFSLSQFNRANQKVLPTAVVDGLLNFDLAGHGTGENLEANSTWNIRDVKLEGTSVGDARGELHWQGGKIAVQGESHGPGGALRFQGEAQTEGMWPVKLAGDYEHFRADPWIQSFVVHKLAAQVTADGTFSVEGPLKNPGQLELRSQARKLEVVASETTWTSQQPFEFRCQNGTLTASRFEMRGPSTALDVEGSIRFAQSNELALNLQGKSDAKLLALFDPALQATGTGEINLSVRGNPELPRLLGTVKVQDVSASYGDLPFRVSALNGDIQLQGERATLGSLRGKSGGGSVILTGFIIVGAAPRFDVHANLEQVRVRYPQEFTSLLTGQLYLHGTSQTATLGGELALRQLLASESVNVVQLVTEFGGPEGTLLPSVSSPLAPKVRLNVQVSSDPDVRLETHELRLLANVDIRLQGSLANPVALGVIHILGGDAIVRGNRYKLNRGDISMTNPIRTQPALDLEATTRIEHYDLTLDLSGPLDRVKIAYRSDPPLPSADILSLLALGYSSQERGTATGARGSVSTTGASALLSEALSSQASGRLRQLFGVSRIKVDPNPSGLPNVAGARITVEQQVTRDLTLTYVTNTATSQQRVVQFEWALSEKVSLIGLRDQNGIFGLELKFRRRLK